MATCKVCGEPYSKKDTRSRSTCGKEDCQKKWKARQAAIAKGREPFIPREIPCAVCKDPFLQRQSNHMVCDKHTCKLAHKRKKARERYKPVSVRAAAESEKRPYRPKTETRFCAWCGQNFTTHFQSPKPFCSGRCEESERTDCLARAFLATVKDPFATMDTLPPGCRSWYQAEMMPVL